MAEDRLILNIDKKEFFDGTTIGLGGKYWEQYEQPPSTGDILLLLLGHGVEDDFDNDEDLSDEFDLDEIGDTFGRWAGDRIVYVGRESGEWTKYGLEFEDLTEIEAPVRYLLRAGFSIAITESHGYPERLPM